MMSDFDCIVIGGGASGLVSAIEAGRNGERVLILERMDRAGKKILASGNGRCNLMNLNDLVYYGDSEFAHRVLGKDYIDTLTDFWESLGLKIRYDYVGRGYPCTFQSSSVLNVLQDELTKKKIPILVNQEVISLQRQPSGYYVYTSEKCYFASRVIVATGGAAQPKLGGNNFFDFLLVPFGHTIIPITPSLVPLKSDLKSVSGLSGIRARGNVSLIVDDLIVHQESGEILFTDSGLSGICIMQCARFVIPGHTVCQINFVPDLFDSCDDAFSYLINQRKRLPFASPVSLLSGLCMPKLAFAICKQSGLVMRGERNVSLNDTQLRRISEILFSYRVRINETLDFNSAQIMTGGIDCKDINPHTMESRLSSGLFVTGEALNVDGDCGGFNLMFAFMSGIRAGKAKGENTVC